MTRLKKVECSALNPVKEKAYTEAKSDTLFRKVLITENDINCEAYVLRTKFICKEQDEQED